MMNGVSMVDLARSPEEIKEDMPMMAAPMKASAPVYPYGCCLSLDDETMEKLGLDGEMPSVGEMLMFKAVAKVTCASENERETGDGKKENCRRIELQIIQMGVVGAEPTADEATAARRNRMFPSMAADNDGE